MLSKKDYLGDFIGFAFNNRHSSEFKIIRTSNGDRFERELLPSQQDSIIEMPGLDGAHFLKSTFQTRSFTIPFAFVDVTEKEIRDMTNWLGTKQTHGLILDEYPYKEYEAKIQGSPQFNYVPFDVDGKRIYKGEGTIGFTILSPYAKAPYHRLGDYRNTRSMSQWAMVSGIKSNLNDYDKFNSNLEAKVYNPGDIPSPLIIFGIKLIDQVGYIDIKYEIKKPGGSNTTIGRMILNSEKLPLNTFLQINSKNKLIESLDNQNKVDGFIYNYAITAGDFIQIEPDDKTDKYITITTSTNLLLLEKNNFHLGYDYWYK